MSAEIINMDQLLQITQNTAMSVSAQSKQMGLILGNINDLKQDVSAIKDEMEVLKHETTVTRNQANRLQTAIHQRVNLVLGIQFSGGKVANEFIDVDKKYRGGFISRCYWDARRKSRLGTPYYTTLRCDFQETLDYIEAWEPEVEGGVEGYKDYLDDRREERKTQKAAGYAR